jgi:hypothetical protein
MTKTGGVNGVFDSGASSVETCPGDCRLEWTVTQLNKERAIGLSVLDPDRNYTSIDYGVDMPASLFYVLERVGPVVTAFGSIALNQVLAIERVGDEISNYRDAELIRVSPTASVGDLRIDTSLSDSGSTIEGIKLFRAGVQIPVTWQNAAGVTIT